MPLIDETTRAGFFHMRLLPFKMRLLETREHTVFSTPDPDAESYFTKHAPGPAMAPTSTAQDCLTASEVVSHAVEHWQRTAPFMAEMCRPLPDLVAAINDEDTASAPRKMSDFVYPLT